MPEPGDGDDDADAPHDDDYRRRSAITMIRIEEHAGSRAELRPLFELAEDSMDALDSYLDDGRVLVAVEDGRIIGHLQLTDTRHRRQLEVKNMAVLESRHEQGIGRALMEAAIEHARRAGRTTLVVATAAADTGNLRFYQRLGFRMRTIERDAFNEAAGYAARILLDGIELRDRVWLDRTVGLTSAAVSRRRPLAYEIVGPPDARRPA